MKFIEFREVIIENVKRYLPKEYEYWVVIEQQIPKVNKCESAFFLIPKSLSGLSDITPVFYFSDLYSKYVSGRKIDTILRDIAKIITNDNQPELFKEVDFSYDSVKDKIILQVINKDINKELLKDAVSRDCLDLAIIYRIILEDEEIEGSAIVNEQLLLQWDKTEDDIYKVAYENTKKLRPFKVKSIMAALGFEGDEKDDNLYVATNIGKEYGATAILYPEILKEGVELLGDSFYIIPSSIHEVLLLKVDERNTPKELAELIKATNDNVLDKDDILSYKLYFYDRESREVSIAA